MAQWQQQPLLETWQWLLLLGFCFTLIVLAVIARIYGRKHQLNVAKTSLLAPWLKAKTNTKLASELSQASVNSQAVGKVMLHQVQLGEREYLVMETVNGLVQLRTEPSSAATSSSSDSVNKEFV